jgi:hypothetical protein
LDVECLLCVKDDMAAAMRVYFVRVLLPQPVLLRQQRHAPPSDLPLTGFVSRWPL